MTRTRTTRLNITITTYVDELHVTFIALKEAVPNVQQLADYAAAAVAELAADLAKATRRKQTTARPRRAKSRKAAKPAVRPVRKRAAVR